MRTRHLIAVTLFALAAFAGSARADLTVYRWPPICLDCVPDVVAEYEPQGNSQGFRVYNIGKATTGTFHIAVLALGDSESFDPSGIPVGGSHWFPVRTSYAGEVFTVILNTGNTMPESNYDNNALTFYGWANID